MGVWAEIKKCVNSDFSKPLNELIIETMFRNDDYYNCNFTTTDLVTSTKDIAIPSDGSSVTICEINIDEVCDETVVIIGGVHTSSSSYKFYAYLYDENDTELGGGYYAGTTQYTLKFSLYNLSVGKYYLKAYGTSGKTAFYKNVSVENANYTKIISEEKYLRDTVKDVIYNTSSSDVRLSMLPRLDRCEFCYIETNTTPTMLSNQISTEGVLYLAFAPPHSMIYVKY